MGDLAGAPAPLQDLPLHPGMTVELKINPADKGGGGEKPGVGGHAAKGERWMPQKSAWVPFSPSAVRETISCGPAERNYFVRDHEILVIKLALEEWRHCLQGAPQPFIIWSDHKNLTHIRTAKRLNSRQARWSLFFDSFNFSLTYHPRSKNFKPDALSRIHAPETSPHDSKPILHPSCVLGALTWEIEWTVRTAQLQDKP
ncbi:hypothetical protein Q8A73_006521 [Channa argus]|nr:hypothetical protein Q8A73_006521 [Channa argus]